MNLPAELAAAIVAAPDDRDVYAVAGDWLEQAGSPQGELVALQLASSGERAGARDDRAAALEHALLPAELRGSCPLTFEWRWGFIRGVLVASLGDPDEARMLRDLLASPIGRFVQKIVIQGGPRLVDPIASASPPCLRTLMLFVAGAVDLRRIPRTLRRFVVRSPTTTGALDLPELLELAIDRNPRTTRLVAESSLPKLERLAIDFGDIDQPATRWLDPESYPALRVLSLCNDRGQHVDSWRRAAIAAQLDLLDFVWIARGQPSVRRFLVDRLPRSDTAGFLVMVGRAPSPGEWIPVATSAEPFDLLGGRARVHRFAHGYVVTGDVHVNGRAMQTSELRSLDEVALRDHVFRFVEGDDAHAVANALRARYAV